jgi:hypothetical protein
VQVNNFFCGLSGVGGGRSGGGIWWRDLVEGNGGGVGRGIWWRDSVKRFGGWWRAMV